MNVMAEPLVARRLVGALADPLGEVPEVSLAEAPVGFLAEVPVAWLAEARVGRAGEPRVGARAMVAPRA